MKRNLCLSILAITFLLATNTAHALDPIPGESGFSGFVRAGVGVINLESNMVAGNRFLDMGSESTNSLTGSADSESSGMAMINFEVAYTFSQTRTQLTLGSQLEDIATMQLSQQLAVKQELPDKSIIMAGFVFRHSHRGMGRPLCD